jgi:hypothetical protein
MQHTFLTYITTAGTFFLSHDDVQIENGKFAPCLCTRKSETYQAILLNQHLRNCTFHSESMPSMPTAAVQRKYCAEGERTGHSCPGSLRPAQACSFTERVVLNRFASSSPKIVTAFCMDAAGLLSETCFAVCSSRTLCCCFTCKENFSSHQKSSSDDA